MNKTHLWPAIPIALPRVTPANLRRHRRMRSLATAVTTIVAVLAVLLVAIEGVLLGIT